MPRRARKRKWYSWIIKTRSDQQEREMNGHPERLSEAKAAQEAAELRYRQLMEKGGAVRKITTESGALKRKNHFSEAIESLLREGAQRRAHGR